MTARPRRPAAGATRSRWAPAAALAALAGLCLVSVAVGAADLSPAELLAGGTASHSARILLVSRIPRTLAAVRASPAPSRRCWPGPAWRWRAPSCR